MFTGKKRHRCLSLYRRCRIVRSTLPHWARLLITSPRRSKRHTLSWSRSRLLTLPRRTHATLTRLSPHVSRRSRATLLLRLPRRYHHHYIFHCQYWSCDAFCAGHFRRRPSLGSDRFWVLLEWSKGWFTERLLSSTTDLAPQYHVSRSILRRTRQSWLVEPELNFSLA